MKILYLTPKIQNLPYDVSSIKNFLFLTKLEGFKSRKLNIDCIYYNNNIKTKFHHLMKSLLIGEANSILSNISLSRLVMKYLLPIEKKNLNKYDLILLSGQNPQLLLLHPIFQKFKDKIISLTDDSLYIANILDKGWSEAKDSLYAKLLLKLEKKVFSEFKITLCSDSYISYVEKLYNIKKGNFIRKPFGAPFEIFNEFSIPQSYDSKIIRIVKSLKGKDYKLVLLFANFHRLHGIEKIIETFNILNNKNKRIKLILIGKHDPNNVRKYNAVLYNSLVKIKKLKNIVYFSQNTIFDLYRIIPQVDLGLGIFSNSVRSNITTPLKLYDMSFSGLPFITKNSDVIKEYFPIEIRHIFSEDLNSKDIALKILEYFEFSQNKRNQLGLLLKNLYFEKFSFDNQIDLVLEHFI